MVMSRKRKRSLIPMPPLPDSCVLEIVRVVYLMQHGVYSVLSILAALGSRDLWKELPSLLWSTTPLPVEFTKMDFIDMYTAYSQTRHKIPAVVAAHKAPGKRVFLFKGLVLKEEWSCSDGGGSGAEYYRVTKVSGGQRETAWVTQVKFQGVGELTRFSQLTVMQNQSADINIHEASVASTRACPKIYRVCGGKRKSELLQVECLASEMCM